MYNSDNKLYGGVKGGHGIGRIQRNTALTVGGHN